MTVAIVNSILAVECGSSNTTAVLIERMGGIYRLRASWQAPSTHHPPWEDVTLGIQEAIRHIEKLVKRTLLSPGGWPITPQTANQQGVDAFIIVSSASPPLQVVLTGLTQDISLTSAQRAAASTYTHVVKTIALDSNDAGQPYNPESHIKAIQSTDADVIVLVGGTDGGAAQPVLNMAYATGVALQMRAEGMPQVLYAGNADLRPAIADILGTITALKSVDNVQPTLDIENITALQLEFEQLYVQQKMLQLPGFDKLKNWSQYDIMPAGKSFEKLVGFVGQHRQLNVLGTSLGSRSTSIATQYQQHLSSTIRSEVGLGQSLASLLALIPIENFLRWLPFELSAAELHHQLLNKSLHPTTIPTSPEDLMIEHAVAREALRLVSRQAQKGLPERQWHLVIATGRPLTGAPQAAHAAMVLLDGLEPWGVTSLALDRTGLVSLLGAIATVEPQAAVQLVEQDTFLTLGTVVAPAGYGEPGQTAIKLKITYPDDTVEEREIRYGSLELIPLPAEQKARLEIRPARHLDIGLGQPGRGAIADIEGGLLGIIIDARGRPLKLPQDDLERQQRLQQWLAALSTNYAPAID